MQVSTLAEFPAEVTRSGRTPFATRRVRLPAPMSPNCSSESEQQRDQRDNIMGIDSHVRRTKPHGLSHIWAFTTSGSVTALNEPRLWVSTVTTASVQRIAVPRSEYRRGGSHEKRLRSQ